MEHRKLLHGTTAIETLALPDTTYQTLSVVCDVVSSVVVGRAPDTTHYPQRYVSSTSPPAMLAVGMA